MNKFHHDFKKRFGQNFLQGDKWPKKIVHYLNPQPEDTVLEIGPGQGALTEKLVASAAQIFAVEIDTDLFPLLLAKFAQNSNFKLIKQDILQVDIDKAGEKAYSVVGSLPYNIAKKIIEKFLLADNKPQKMIFIIQKEVAQDYTAMPTKASFLSMFAQVYSDVKYLHTIKSTEFYPVPQVDGAIIEFSNIKPKFDNAYEIQRFIKAGYLQPRKKLSSALASQGFDKALVENKLVELGLTATARAGELSLDNWHQLYLLVHNTK
jgi:16S rRNA (adenine1518-N6/adenine1519-N6)-dimethyltransferase